MIALMNDEAKNLAHNLKRLMEHHADTQHTLANRSGISQKTISNMINPGDGKSPNLENVSKAASAYRLETWHLLYPNAPIEILTNSSIEKLVHNYVVGDKAAREAITQVSEITAKYSKSA